MEFIYAACERQALALSRRFHHGFRTAGPAVADHIAKTRGFSFAILAQCQRPVAEVFAGRSEPERRFDEGRWLTWKSGHPRLVGAVAAMDCALIGGIETGTHALFAGGIIDIDLVADRAPLIWHRRQYKFLEQQSGDQAALRR